MAKLSEIIVAEVQRKAALLDSLDRVTNVRIFATVDLRDGRVKVRISPEIDCGTVGVRGES